MSYIYALLGSGISSVLLVLITQFFTGGQLGLFPVFLMYWGIILAALGLGNNPVRMQKTIFTVLSLQGAILLVVGILFIFKIGYHSNYLFKSIIGLIVLVTMGLSYYLECGSKKG
ncbi:MAG: hypothetical protein GY855_07520 [candidate division Zixibacteria bacterium]|nr:hypothetical protein [candidate division Zixibacteria bacterium]